MQPIILLLNEWAFPLLSTYRSSDSNIEEEIDLSNTATVEVKDGEFFLHNQYMDTTSSKQESITGQQVAGVGLLNSIAV